MGWLYYGITRALRPKMVIAIGSGRGFVPILLARAQKDAGALPIQFVDPSFDDDFWTDPSRVRQWFVRFGIEDHVVHHLQTTAEFAETYFAQPRPPVDLLFVDGGHFYETVRLDIDLLADKVAPDGYILIHDTASRSRNPRWWGPRQVIAEMFDGDPAWQQVDFPFGAGLTILRRRPKVAAPEFLTELASRWAGGHDDFE
jgi:predicted O-methyltransferase YrrM